MNLLKVNFYLCIILLLIVVVWPTPKGISQPLESSQSKEDSQITQSIKKTVLLDTTDAVKRGQDIVEQSILEAKKGKSLSRSIQKESKKKPRQAEKMLEESDKEGLILYKQPGLKDSILVTSDSTFIELNKPQSKDSIKSKTKEPFFFKWFRKHK